jgi:thioredoxin-dependent peroxiredoxin
MVDPNPRHFTTDLELVLSDGQHRPLPQLAGTGPLVLFFFPAAFSPGCTAEACAFRDLAAEFTAVGATCVGVSADSPRRLRAFARTLRLGLPLVSDRGGRLADLFGARRRFPARMLRRVTVVLASDGTQLARIDHLTDLAGHADAALDVLRGSADIIQPPLPLS